MKYKIREKTLFDYDSHTEEITYTCLCRKHWWSKWMGVGAVGLTDVWQRWKYFPKREIAISQTRAAIELYELQDRYPKYKDIRIKL